MGRSTYHLAHCWDQQLPTPVTQATTSVEKWHESVEPMEYGQTVCLRALVSSLSIVLALKARALKNILSNVYYHTHL